MAALLVAMSVMAVMMAVAMPVWKQMAQREKEEELVFRGQQYARAVGLFMKKYANASPPSMDVLLQQRFLRKKYKDPITNDDFLPLYAGQSAPGVAQQQNGAQPGRGGGTAQPSAPATAAPTGAAPATGVAGATGGGIIGVASKSKAASIRVYNGRTHYNEWQFVYITTTQTPGVGGATAPGRGGPGRGNTQQAPQQPGAGPFGGARGQEGRGNGPRGNGGQQPFPNPFGNPDGNQQPIFGGRSGR
jgi:type II secretory pathway pseudopilin PulG